MQPAILEAITAGVLVYLINRYITSQINFCYPCEFFQQQMYESDRQSEQDSRESSATSTTVSDSTDVRTDNTNEHIVYEYHPYFLTIR